MNAVRRDAPAQVLPHRTPRPPKPDARLRAAADWVVPCDICADIGCDHGRFGATLLLEKRCHRLLAADISEKALAKAKSRLTALGLAEQTVFTVADGLDAPRPITSLPGVVQHSIDSLKAEAARAVEAGLGGVMLFGVPNEDDKDAAGSARASKWKTEMAAGSPGLPVHPCSAPGGKTQRERSAGAASSPETGEGKVGEMAPAWTAWNSQ